MSDDISTATPEASGPAQLREALERKEERIRTLEAKLADTAFKEAGFFGGTKERKALEKFYTGDRTDAAAIRRFAEEELGYTPQSAPRGEVPHVDPAATVPTDARIDRIDAAATPMTSAKTPEELATETQGLLKQAITPGADNMAAIEQSITAELTRMGFQPGVVP